MRNHPYLHAVAYACGMWLAMSALVAVCVYAPMFVGGAL